MTEFIKYLVENIPEVIKNGGYFDRLQCEGKNIRLRQFHIKGDAFY